jgi:hypothetical protein
MAVVVQPMLQFDHNSVVNIFSVGKVSVYTILGHEEKKNMLTVVETFRSNATKTECILMQCSQKNNVESANSPYNKKSKKKYPYRKIHIQEKKTGYYFGSVILSFCDDVYLSNYQGLK